ncbi:MAG: hypothetical protein ACI82F_004282 [Planctomycetota bacterium]|jgi:hypothetical protein
MIPSALLRLASRVSPALIRSMPVVQPREGSGRDRAMPSRGHGGLIVRAGVGLLAAVTLAVAGCSGGGESPNDICLAACQANSVFHSQYKQCVADNCLTYVPDPPVWDRTTIIWAIDSDTGEVLPPTIIYTLRTPSIEERFVPKPNGPQDSKVMPRLERPAP